MNIRIVPTRVHGIVDYVSAALLPMVPRMFGWDRRVTRLHDTIAAASAGQSLMTDYELGVVKILPMKAHLSVDAAAGCFLMGTAAVMTDEPAAARATMAGTGLFFLAAALLTKTTPDEKQVEGHVVGRGRTIEPSYGTRQSERPVAESGKGV